MRPLFDKKTKQTIRDRKNFWICHKNLIFILNGSLIQSITAASYSPIQTLIIQGSSLSTRRNLRFSVLPRDISTYGPGEDRTANLGTG